MPTSEVPTKLNGEQGTTEVGEESRNSGGVRTENGVETESQPRPSSGGSRWVDYDTHELLEMISELEDERRWARLREGILWALLFHILLLLSITILPTYFLHANKVIDPFDAIKERKDLTYLDLPPDALKNIQPKVAPKPEQRPQIDKKTLEEMQKQAPPAPAAPPPPQEAVEQSKPQAAPPIPPQQQTQSELEAPKPSAVPAKPNFSQLSQNPADSLQQAMRDAARNRGAGTAAQLPGGLPRHPGAGTGGLQILSDTQGVDFSSWLAAWYYETRRTWDPLIPEEVNPPIAKQGQVMIRFKVLPNGRLMDGSLVLEGRSGDVALDRAAWGALTGSNYPQLPRDFHGPYLELRALFLYNLAPPQ
jgi:outer membrane biosynthesis protein TonB